VLDGFSTPATDGPVREGGDVQHPLDSSKYTAVTKIIVMRDGEPDDNGSDVNLYLADGTMYRIVNTPITFAYKIDPLEKPLTDEELKFTVQVAWSLEQGTPIDGQGQVQHDGRISRATRHGQMDDIEAGLGILRRNKAQRDADLRISGIAGVEDGDEDGVSAEDIALSQPADLEGVVN
jgi:hypothetical protein